MPIMRLRDVGKRGVTTDLPPFDLTPGDWSEGNNVRFQANRLQKIGGATAALLKNMPNEVPIAVVQRPIKEDLIYGTTILDEDGGITDTGHLWSAEGGNHINISKYDTSKPILDSNGKPVLDEDGKPTYEPYLYQVSFMDYWNYTTLSNTVVYTNLKDEPQGIAPNDPRFSDLPGWGYPNGEVSSDGSLKPIGDKAIWRTNRIRAYKNYLLALGMLEDNESYPQRVRWSDVAFVSELPSNWYQNLQDHDGGFNDLTDSQSHIIDGFPLRDSFVIYTNRDTFIMDYVGGAMVFNFRKIFSDSGILAPNCAVEFEGQHFVISEEDIFVHNGSTRRSVATGRVKDFLMSQISGVNYLGTRVFSYPTRKEIWIAYVGPGQVDSSTETNNPLSYACNKAAVWSWQYDTWSFTDLPDIYDIGMGIAPDTDTRTWDGYKGDPTIGPIPGDDIWAGKDEAAREEVWEQFAQTFTKHQMYSCSVDKCFYNLDNGYYWEHTDMETLHKDLKAAGGDWSKLNPRNYITRDPVICEVTRQALDFDEQEPDISYQKWWRAVYPQMTGKGKVLFYVGGASNPSELPEWDSVQEFVIGEDFKVDCFSNYRYPAIRIVDSAEGEWSMTGYDVEYFREGNR